MNVGNTGENSHRRALEDVALDGLKFAEANNYSSEFQGILDMTGAGLAGQTASPEGLVLKALYHQHRNIAPAHGREDSALKEIADVYSGVYGELSPQTTPPVIRGLALILQRATRPVEQELVADALEAAAKKIRASGYIHGK